LSTIDLPVLVLNQNYEPLNVCRARRAIVLLYQSMEVFNRDHYSCQYCGKETRQLTLDHMIPRCRGGPHTWENLVSACVSCNRRKAGKTLAEAGMKLLHPPTTPRGNRYSYIPSHYLETREEWQRYLPH